VIAGGAVRDTLIGREPKDYDVFVNCSEKEAEKITSHMFGLKMRDVPESHKSEPFLKGTWEVDGVDVQVMWTPKTTIEELMSGFDWNVCLFAFDGVFHQREEVTNIAAGKSLRLVTITYPISTLRRGFRFSERFGMKLERSDLFAICKRVMALEAVVPTKLDAGAT
jgi:hypothetical protein